MSYEQLVKTDKAEFYVEVAERPVARATDEAEESLLGSGHLPDVPFDGVRHTIEEIGETLAHAWDAAKPDEASVEFGLKLTAKTGKLTGILVEGGGEATMSVKLTWKPTAAPAA